MINFIKNTKHTKFIIKSDSASWVLDEIKYELEKILKNNFFIINQKFIRVFFNQCLFFLNKYDLLNRKYFKNKIGLSLFHFDPREKEKNIKILEILKKEDCIKAIQVTNDKLQNYLIKKGIRKKKIFKIPIGIDLNKFRFTTLQKKIANKKKLKLDNFLVIGSFQKDGIGWDDGSEPKKIKGPDIFIKIVKELSKKQKVHVLLSGPARGYVKNNLKKLKISFSHHFYKNYYEIKKLYSLIDIYIVTSRVEGGPRAILEAMASGAVIFSTKVGQAEEIIKHNKNGYLYDQKDIRLVSKKIINIFHNVKKKAKMIKEARISAQEFSYLKTKTKWVNFFNSIQS